MPLQPAPPAAYRVDTFRGWLTTICGQLCASAQVRPQADLMHEGRTARRRNEENGITFQCHCAFVARCLRDKAGGRPDFCASMDVREQHSACYSLLQKCVHTISEGLGKKCI